jgi:hypothetical protein
VSEPTNEHAEIAARLLGSGSPAYLHPSHVPAAQVHALLALATEVAELRRELVEGMGPAGAIVGFLDEIAVRLAPEGDSIAEAVVSASERGEDL